MKKWGDVKFVIDHYKGYISAIIQMASDGRIDIERAEDMLETAMNNLYNDIKEIISKRK